MEAMNFTVTNYTKLEGVVVPNYSYVFWFERNYNEVDTNEWLLNNWHHCFYYAGLYLLLIRGGLYYMKHRPPYGLRGLLIAWNFLLALFSLLGAIRTTPELLFLLREFNFRHSLCQQEFWEYRQIVGFWASLFAYSKIIELGDTAFIVLRKQPLKFLHWYHHLTVLLVSWYITAYRMAIGRWFMVMNYTVHSVMYTYYGMRALRVPVPRFVNVFITGTQLLQMVVGLYINASAYLYHSDGGFCNVTFNSVAVSFLMYFSYFLLFLHFFFTTYVWRTKTSGVPIKKKN